MGVFLTILKILGIILASLIGFIILMVLLVLYAPVRYKIKGAYNSDIDGTVKVRWLFAGVSGNVLKNDEAGMSVLVKIKVFGIPIKKLQVIGGDKEDDSGGHKKSKKEKVKKKKKNKGRDDDLKEAVSEETGTTEASRTADVVTSDPGGSQPDTPVSENVQASDMNAEVADDSVDESVIDKKAEKKRRKAEKKAEKEAKKAAKKAAKEAGKPAGDAEGKNIADRIDVIYDKTEAILEKVSAKTEMIKTKKNHILEFFDRPYVQKTIKRGKKVLRRLFKNLLPRKGDVNLLIGLKSPSSTGEILGKVSMFYPLYYRWLHITPEFHEQRIEADLWCKGRMHIGSFAVPALFMYLSRDFKKTMNLAKKI